MTIGLIVFNLINCNYYILLLILFTQFFNLCFYLIFYTLKLELEIVNVIKLCAWYNQISICQLLIYNHKKCHIFIFNSYILMLVNKLYII